MTRNFLSPNWNATSPVEMDRKGSSHFRILEDIAQNLSGDANFPTCLDAAAMVRNTLREDNVTLDRVAQAVGLEPLIASKLLRIANSVAYNPSGRVVSDLKAVIGRLGFEVVRTTSLAVAMDQMLKSQQLAIFEDLARFTWEHCLEVAAISRVLARRIGRANPEEALLAGMVHEIGAFYLLYRAAEYPEYQKDEQAVRELVAGWQASIGESLLQALGLPEQVVEAVRDHDKTPDTESPCALKDVLYFANLLAGDTPWNADPQWSETQARDRARYADLLEEAQDDIRELRAALAA